MYLHAGAVGGTFRAWACGLPMALTLLSGCSTNPTTGRDQILALPAVQAAHAEVMFAISAPLRAASTACERDCGSPQFLGAFAGRVKAIGAELEAAAREMAPDLFGRIDGFQIEINDGFGGYTWSSAGGRIRIGSALAVLEPEDTVIAFLLAREMAHVIARHAEENSGASIAFSMLGMLLPGVNVIARFIATKVSADALISSWAPQQQREADEIALKLLQRTGRIARDVAVGLDFGIRRARLPDDDWGARYLRSAERVARIAELPPLQVVTLR